MGQPSHESRRRSREATSGAVTRLSQFEAELAQVQPSELKVEWSDVATRIDSASHEGGAVQVVPPQPQHQRGLIVSLVATWLFGLCVGAGVTWSISTQRAHPAIGRVIAPPAAPSIAEPAGRLDQSPSNALPEQDPITPTFPAPRVRRFDAFDLTEFSSRMRLTAGGQMTSSPWEGRPLPSDEDRNPDPELSLVSETPREPATLISLTRRWSYTGTILP